MRIYSPRVVFSVRIIPIGVLVLFIICYILYVIQIVIVNMVDVMKKLFNVGVVLLLIITSNLFSMQRHRVDVLKIYTMPEGVISREHLEDIEREKSAQEFRQIVVRYENQHRGGVLWAEHANLQAEIDRGQRRARIANIRHGLYGNGY